MTKLTTPLKTLVLIALVVFVGCVSTAKAPNDPLQQKFKVATTQFPVSGDIHANAEYIKKFIAEAAENNTDIIQFCETALSGYAYSDIKSFDDFDWQKLRAETHEIMALAKKHKIWVVLGSTHYISEDEKPTNCLYLISDQGKIIDRYDKSILTTGDLIAYTPGNHRVTFELKGYKCGLLICYDAWYPEMYNYYRHQGVKIMFNSFYNARHRAADILDWSTPATISVRASDNRMWVFASNSSAHYSCWSSRIARPDSSFEAMERHIPGLLYRRFPDSETTDKFRSWTHNEKIMKLAPNEVYTNGKPSKHPRATNRQTLP